MERENHSDFKVTLYHSGKICEIEEAAIWAIKEGGRDVEVSSPIHSDQENSTGLMIGPMKPFGKGIKLINPDMGMRVWYTEQPPQYSLSNKLLGVLASLRLQAEDNKYLAKLPGGRILRLAEIESIADRFSDFSLSTYSKSNQEFFESIGIPAKPVAPGYYPELGHNEGIPLTEREIDVIFLGSTKGNRREEIIRKFQSVFSKRAINFVVVDGNNLGLSNTYGDDRTKLLNNSKILLALGRDELDDHVFRMCLGGANGTAVVAEQANSAMTYPFRAGEHFSMDTISRLPDLITDMLGNIQEIQNQAENLNKLVVSIPMSNQIKQVLR